MADDKQINYNITSDNAMPRDMMIVSRKSTFVIDLSKTDWFFFFMKHHFHIESTWKKNWKINYGYSKLGIREISFISKWSKPVTLKK